MIFTDDGNGVDKKCKENMKNCFKKIRKKIKKRRKRPITTVYSHIFEFM